MKNTVECLIEEEDLLLLESGDQSACESLLQAHFESLDENDVQTLLAEFCTQERETFDGNTIVENIEFDSALSGLLYVGFTGSSYFGCRDMDRTYNYTEEVIFQIHMDRRRIVFSTETPDPIDRSPHEEF